MFYFDKAALQHSSLSNSAVTFHFASDHSYDHTDLWNSQVAKIAQKHNQICVEAGVVVNCWKVGGNHPSEIDVLFEVRWDCGTKKVYSHAGGELEKIRILDMGPTGMRQITLVHGPVLVGICWITVCRIIQSMLALGIVSIFVFKSLGSCMHTYPDVCMYMYLHVSLLASIILHLTCLCSQICMYMCTVKTLMQATEHQSYCATYA